MRTTPVDADTLCPARRRLQSAVDAFISVVLAMLIWPFPIARATMGAFAQVVGILATVVVVQAIYFCVASVLWGETLGMRLAGMRLAESSDTHARASALRWGLLSATLAWWFILSPRSACAAALAETWSGREPIYSGE